MQIKLNVLNIKWYDLYYYGYLFVKEHDGRLLSLSMYRQLYGHNGQPGNRIFPEIRRGS